MSFAINDKVSFTVKTRSGEGVITDISHGAKGAFYEVTQSDGKKTKVRAGQMKAA